MINRIVELNSATYMPFPSPEGCGPLCDPCLLPILPRSQHPPTCAPPLPKGMWASSFMLPNDNNENNDQLLHDNNDDQLLHDNDGQLLYDDDEPTIRRRP